MQGLVYLMSSFDFSMFDMDDNSSPKKVPKSRSDFDFDVYETPETKPKKSFLDTAKDYGKTILKGSAEGLSKLGGLMGPLQDIHGEPYSESLKKQSENLDKLFPTEDPDYIQSSLRRGLKEAPSALSFPGSTLSTLPRSIAAGFLGQGAEELGLPEWAQTAAELTAYIGPDITKKLLEKGSNAELIAEARRLGLTDEQITPLIQSEFKQKWLSKLAPKRGDTQKALSETKSGLGNIYANIESSPYAAKEILA